MQYIQPSKTCLTDATPSSYCILQMTIDDAKIQGFKCSFLKTVSNSIENSNTARNSFLKVGNVVLMAIGPDETVFKTPLADL